jgi:hypothetical protein
MVKQRHARITDASEVHGKTIIGILYRGVPLDFGLDNRRLRGPSPCFYLRCVVGYVPGKKAEDYKEFGPSGLARGVQILCDVDDQVPAGIVSKVRPV